jgi:hypothetical protein
MKIESAGPKPNEDWIAHVIRRENDRVALETVRDHANSLELSTAIHDRWPTERDDVARELVEAANSVATSGYSQGSNGHVVNVGYWKRLGAALARYRATVDTEEL